jgi:hypothetical protein
MFMPPTEDKIVVIQDRFYEELEHVRVTGLWTFSIARCFRE